MDSLKTCDFNRYHSCLFLNGSIRQDVNTLYSFYNELYRLTFHTSDPMVSLIRLQWFIETLEGKDHPNRLNKPLIAALFTLCNQQQPLTARHFIPLVQSFISIIDCAPFNEVTHWQSTITAPHIQLITLTLQLIHPDHHITQEIIANAATAYAYTQTIQNLGYLKPEAFLATFDITQYNLTHNPFNRDFIKQLASIASSHLDRLTQTPLSRLDIIAFLPLVASKRFLHHLQQSDYQIENITKQQNFSLQIAQLTAYMKKRI